jgi:Spy/CpxP family protein refolding chaperone
MFNKSKAWAVGLLAAVLVVGLLAGAALQGWIGFGRGRCADRTSYSGYLTRELKLTKTQHDAVAALLHKHQPEMRAIIQVVRPQLDSARARVSDEIRTILTPAQREAYQRLLDRDRAERARADSAAAAQAKKP